MLFLWYKHPVADPHATPNLSQLDDRLFTSAKRWFAAGVTSRFATAGVGLLAIIPEFALAAPFVIAPLAVAAEACTLRSDLVKSRADRILKMIEMSDGFGWEADKTALADILATVPQKFEEPSKEIHNRFASREPAGAERAFDNLKESAWWTQQLALITFKWLALIVTCLVGASISFLVFATITVVSTQSRVTVARVVTAVLITVFSAGLVKLTYAYHLLYERSKYAVMRITAMRNSDELARRIGVLYEYQNARSSGPLIPDSVYRLKRSRLNALWQLQSRT
jgi:hypothetical protein